MSGMYVDKLFHGHANVVLDTFPEKIANCVVTSPPYYGLRDYGEKDQLGLEETPEEYIQNMVEVFRKVSRVLKDDGTLWVNIGDSYWGGKGKSGSQSPSDAEKRNIGGKSITKKYQQLGGKYTIRPTDRKHDEIKPKDMIGIPWMLAFALRADGWYLRQDIIWNKPNPMPESVTDRCTKSHEYIFLLSKSAKYYFDAKSIATPYKDKTFSTYGCKVIASGDGSGMIASENWGSIKERKPKDWTKQLTSWQKGTGTHDTLKHNTENGRKSNTLHQEQAKVYAINGKGMIGHSGYKDKEGNPIGDGLANKKSVWTVSPRPFKEAHFATYPEELIIDCIKAGCPEGGLVLDPFMGAGTTAVVAKKLNRHYIGIDLNRGYINEIAEPRIRKVTGLFSI